MPRFTVELLLADLSCRGCLVRIVEKAVDETVFVATAGVVNMLAYAFASSRSARRLLLGRSGRRPVVI